MSVNQDQTEELVTLEQKLNDLVVMLHRMHNRLYGPTVTEEKQEKLPLADRLHSIVADCSASAGSIEQAIIKFG